MDDSTSKEKRSCRGEEGSQFTKIFIDVYYLYEEYLILDAKKFADSIGAIFVETSAKTAVNVEAMFHALRI